LPSAKDKDDARASIDWACLNFLMMMSLLLNLAYRLFMESSVKAVADWMITLCDSFGFEVHFMRFLYWALLDGSLNAK